MLNNNFQVLRAWRNKSGPDLTVKGFVENITIWERSGYLDSDVWVTLHRFVNPDLLPPVNQGATVDYHETEVCPPKKSRQSLGEGEFLKFDVRIL